MYSPAYEHALLAEVSKPAQEIVRGALATVDDKFSISGDPNQDPYAKQHFPYHNGRHSRLVCSNIRLLRDVVGLTPSEFSVAIAAGASHDLYQGTGQDEPLSAEWLTEQMEQYAEFTPTQAEYGRLAIYGTMCTSDESIIIKQLATVQDYPSKRAELIAHVVAGADLGHLFKPLSPLLSHLLHQEMQTDDTGEAPSMESVVAFQHKQILLFDDGYTYPSRDIERALSTHKRVVNHYNKTLLHDLEAGTVENWSQILNRDRAFIVEQI